MRIATLGWLRQDANPREYLNGWWFKSLDKWELPWSNTDYDSRLSLAENRHEIYVQFTKWGTGYPAYPRNGTLNDDILLRVESRGPLYAGNAFHMEVFGAVMVAVILVLKEHAASSSTGLD